MICFVVSIRALFFCAWLHQSQKIRKSRLSESVWITESVNVSHHLPACDIGCPARTVRVVFRRRTPWWAQWVKLPPVPLSFGEGLGERFVFVAIPPAPLSQGGNNQLLLSLSNSLNIFTSDGGFLTPSCTENESP